MNPALYHLAVSMVVCRVANAVAYTIGTMVGLNPVRNCYIMLAIGVLSVMSVFHYSF